MNKNSKLLIGVTAIMMVILVYFIIFSLVTNRISIVRDSSNTKEWGIKFANLEDAVIHGKAKEINKPSINTYDTSISVYDVALYVPGDAITYRFDVVNDGDYDGIISSVDIPKPKCTGMGKDAKEDEIKVCSHIHYTLSYEDGSSVSIGDVLRKQESKKMVLSLRYDDLLGSEDIAKNTVYISNLDIDINYAQCTGECKVSEK